MGNDNTSESNYNHQNIRNKQDFGKISIIETGDSILKSDKNCINQIINDNKNKNNIKEQNINNLLLKEIKEINSNLISLNEKDKSLPLELKELKNSIEKFGRQKNNGMIIYDSALDEMKSDFIKKKNKKFKYEIKNEIKNTLIKPILDTLRKKDEEIAGMKSQIEDLKNNILKDNNEMKKEFDSKIESLQNRNNVLSEQFEKHNLDMEKIINKYDNNFLTINKQFELINLNVKNMEDKNKKEIDKIQKKIPEEINLLKNQINTNINKKEIECNSKIENVSKLNKENIIKIENLRKQYEEEINILKKETKKLDEEQKKLKIENENKSKELKEHKEKIFSNKNLIDNAIKEIDIINKNSKKNTQSLINESFRKFNSIFQKNYALNKYKTQKELKIKLFNQKNYARVGLTNIGNNCYLNSVLQLLKNIPKFTYNFYLMDENSGKFLLSLKKLFLRICFSRDSSFSPKEFKDNLGKENKRFAGDNQYDSTIFYISLLNIIQKKLNTQNNNYKKIDNKQHQNESLEEKYKEFKENYLSKYPSFITDYFYTFYMSEIECNFCHNKSQAFQCTNFLDFPIISEKTEVKNLEECFNNYQMIKSITFECSECKKKNSSQNFTIMELPPILMINLKRVGEGKAHFNEIEIPFQLDMEKLIKRTKINSIYELRGFIKHLGDESSGHNYSFCKNMFDDKWYEYNDSYCIPIEGEPILDKIFLLCYVKVGSDIQDVYYLKKIMDSLDEKKLNIKKY